MKSLWLKAGPIFSIYLLSVLFHPVAHTKKLSFCGIAVQNRTLIIDLKIQEDPAGLCELSKYRQTFLSCLLAISLAEVNSTQCCMVLMPWSGYLEQRLDRVKRTKWECIKGLQ